VKIVMQVLRVVDLQVVVEASVAGLAVLVEDSGAEAALLVVEALEVDTALEVALEVALVVMELLRPLTVVQQLLLPIPSQTLRHLVARGVRRSTFAM
jgi:hypothetical protein